MKNPQSRKFVVAELSEDLYFTLAGHSNPKWSPDRGTPDLRKAVMWPPFASAQTVLAAISNICIDKRKTPPKISRIVSVEAIIVRPIYEATECESQAPESSSLATEPIEYFSKLTSLQVLTRLEEIRTLLSSLREERQKNTSKSTSRKSRSTKRSR